MQLLGLVRPSGKREASPSASPVRFVQKNVAARMGFGRTWTVNTAEPSTQSRRRWFGRSLRPSRPSRLRIPFRRGPRRPHKYPNCPQEIFLVQGAAKSCFGAGHLITSVSVRFRVDPHRIRIRRRRRRGTGGRSSVLRAPAGRQQPRAPTWMPELLICNALPAAID